MGAARHPVGIDGLGQRPASGANEVRYQRMWLSKMTRTGLLFPDESRPANEGFSGFGGGSSASTSRRGSSSSIASSSSDASVSTSSMASSSMSAGGLTTKFVNKPLSLATFTISDKEKLRQENHALMVLTHPNLEKWHKDSIRNAVGEYGIGIILVPLGEDNDGDEELPVLKPLDPRTMTSFAAMGSFGAAKKVQVPTLDEEIVLKVNGKGNVEDIIEDIVDGVRDIMNA